MSYGQSIEAQHGSRTSDYSLRQENGEEQGNVMTDDSGN